MAAALRRETELTVVATRPRPAGHFTYRGRRTVATIQAKLRGTFLARAGGAALFYLAIVTAAECATLFVSARAGLLMHALVFVLIVTHSALMRGLNDPLANLLVALGPVPLIRIASLTSPLAQISYIHWFSILAAILYAGIVASVRILKPDVRDIGLRLPELRHLPLELGIIAAGFGFGWLEYQVLRPGALIPELSLRYLIAPIIVLYVATGLLEELVFRGILQKYAGEAVGVWPGIALSTALFAVLHVGWNSWLDVFFVAAVGGLYALVVRKTRSIIGVSISHGVTNTMLFLVMPFVGR